MLCLPVPFVSQLCRVPLGTFGLHRGDGLVPAEGRVRRELGVAAIPHCPSMGIVFFTDPCGGGHPSSLGIPLSWDLQQAAVGHRVLLREWGLLPFPRAGPHVVLSQAWVWIWS